MNGKCMKKIEGHAKEIFEVAEPKKPLHGPVVLAGLMEDVLYAQL